MGTVLAQKGGEIMSDTKKMTVIATKGTLDWAYPPYILSSTAAALGYDVVIFTHSMDFSCSGRT
jgi:predicted peroxiredoxin